MQIRIAKQTDIADLLRLLRQISQIHHDGRPDLFKSEAEKYSESDLELMLKDRSRPIFVAVREQKVIGYIFCILKRPENSSIMTDILTLHIDDLCIDEAARGEGVGTQLMEHAKCFAKECGCYNLTLNVWALNEKGMHFYEKCGLRPQKIGMETVLR